ncbi:MAG: S1 RNA-binding domain-containing protein [Candidatus Lokiarchaeota archaeon]|nr:S1 RNA-binding domain-containing protein [Candidatus Lokiarchaeota archaeon]
MVKKRQPFPVEDELVVVQVVDIERMAIYVELEDYEGNTRGGRARGMVHISELANRWIRNITNYVKLNQRIVLKVLRVNPEKGHIDLSLRRVNNEQQSNVMSDWKFERKCENLFRLFGNHHKMNLEQVYEKIGFPMLDVYGTLHDAFDGIKEEGIEELKKLDLNISEDLLTELFEMIDSNIQLSQVEIEGKLELVVYDENGIEIIKDAFKASEKIKKDKLTELHIHYIGAPVYSLRVIASDYRKAEGYLKKITDTIQKYIESNNGEFLFERTD